MKFLPQLKLVSLFLSLAACNTTNLSSETIVTQKAPDRDLSVEVLSSIPTSSFGPHPVRIYVIQAQQRDLLIRTPVFNDGEKLTTKNVEIRFKGETLFVCLKGKTQVDKLIEFNSKTKDYLVTEGSCQK